MLLAINIVFVPRYGYMACAWGGLAGYGVCMVLSYAVGRRKNPVPYKLLPLAGYFVLALGHMQKRNLRMSSLSLVNQIRTVG